MENIERETVLHERSDGNSKWYNKQAKLYGKMCKDKILEMSFNKYNFRKGLSLEDKKKTIMRSEDYMISLAECIKKHSTESANNYYCKEGACATDNDRCC